MKKQLYFFSSPPCSCYHGSFGLRRGCNDSCSRSCDGCPCDCRSCSCNGCSRDGRPRDGRPDCCRTDGSSS